jgi:phage gp36-like protein
MAYIAQADLEERFGAQTIVQLADRDRNGVADSTFVAAAMADAEAEVNGYLSTRYTLPLSSTPDTVKRLCAIVARYNLYERAVSEDHPAYVAYRAAQKELAMIAAGTVALPLASGASVASQSGGFAYAQTDAVFDRSGLLDE